ncbi:MAG: hypothetical protein ACFCUI_09435 [Bernardetiaceae bacterium]
MKYTYTYQLTPDELTDYLLDRYWNAPAHRKRRWLLRWGLPPVAFLTGGYLLFSAGSFAGQLYGAFVALVGVALLFFPTLYRYRIATGIRLLSDHAQGKLLFVPTDFTFDNQSMTFQITDYEPLKISYADLTHIHQTPDLIGVHWGEGQAYRLIPKRIFTELDHAQQLIAHATASL